MVLVLYFVLVLGLGMGCVLVLVCSDECVLEFVYSYEVWWFLVFLGGFCGFDFFLFLDNWL